MKTLTAILLCVLFAACARKHYPGALTTTVKDTTFTKIEYSDTVVRIPAKTVEVLKLLPGNCPDFDTTVKKSNSTVIVKKKGEALYVRCNEDSLNLVIAGLNKKIFQQRYVTTQEPVAVYVDKPFIPKWVWWGMAILAGAAAWGNRKFIVRIVKLITGLWA